MGFFDDNRSKLLERGIDPRRLPPGQYFTERFPVLHLGEVPDYGDLDGWELTVTGLVERPLRLSWDDVLALPAVDVTVDIHCVTKWTKFDTTWRGVPFSEITERAGVKPAASHVLLTADESYTTDLPLADLLGTDESGQPKALLAYRYNGLPLEEEHGYPLRLVVPARYFWKSAKWLRGIHFASAPVRGFWERNGYHHRGDPFSEERYSRS